MKIAICILAHFRMTQIWSQHSDRDDQRFIWIPDAKAFISVFLMIFNRNPTWLTIVLIVLPNRVVTQIEQQRIEFFRHKITSFNDHFRNHVYIYTSVSHEQLNQNGKFNLFTSVLSFRLLSFITCAIGVSRNRFFHRHELRARLNETFFFLFFPYGNIYPTHRSTG